ncbi:MAG: lamin tail domain-containing protein [Candidatus Pacearchaeota archaeon]
MTLKKSKNSVKFERIFYLVVFLVIFAGVVRANLVINEVMYDAIPLRENGYEWIEIYNNGYNNINLEGAYIVENGGSFNFSLVRGDEMVLEPDEYAVIVQNPQIFLNENQGYEGKIIQASFSLDNSGEYIEIRDRNNNLLDSLNFTFFVGAAGDGDTISLINPYFNGSAIARGGGPRDYINIIPASPTPGRRNSRFVYLQQTINLRTGWNLVSSYLVPEDSRDLEEIFAPLIERGVLLKVKDSHGRIFVPELGVNDIGEWNPQEPYYIQVSSPTSFTIRGGRVINRRFELNRGWNYIAYPLYREYNMSDIIENVFRGEIRDRIDFVKNPLGRFYDRQHNFDNIKILRVGEGYLIKSNENRVVIDFTNMLPNGRWYFR